MILNHLPSEVNPLQGYGFGFLVYIVFTNNIDTYLLMVLLSFHTEAQRHRGSQRNAKS